MQTAPPQGPRPGTPSNAGLDLGRKALSCCTRWMQRAAQHAHAQHSSASSGGRSSRRTLMGTEPRTGGTRPAGAVPSRATRPSSPQCHCGNTARTDPGAHVPDPGLLRWAPGSVMERASRGSTQARTSWFWTTHTTPRGPPHDMRVRRQHPQRSAPYPRPLVHGVEQLRRGPWDCGARTLDGRGLYCCPSRPSRLIPVFIRALGCVPCGAERSRVCASDGKETRDAHSAIFFN